MMNKFYLKFLTAIILLGGNYLFAQTNPALEMAGPASGNGLVKTYTATLQKNTNNPTGNTFVAYTTPSALTVKYDVSNSAFTNSIYFGDAAEPAYAQMTNIGSVGSGLDNGQYTSYGVTAGTGIDINSNFGIRITNDVAAAGNQPGNGRIKFGEITMTYSRATNNPLLHFKGLGGFANQSFTAEFTVKSVLNSAGTDILAGTTISSSSGNLNVNNGTKRIDNDYTGPTDAATVNSGRGTVLFSNNDVKTIVLEVFTNRNGTAANVAWTGADAYIISTSVGESDLQVTKSVNNTTPFIGSNVVFTVVAKNNGSSNNTNVSVNDLLPNGYTYVSHTASGTTSYVPGSGLWTIGALTDGSSATLAVTATVKDTGIYTNTAVISTTNTTPLIDPDPSNNSASSTILQVKDTDSDGVPDYLDLDDDNDGILDIDEECKGFYSQNNDGVWKGKTASNVTFTNTFTNISDHAQAGAYASTQIKFNVNNGNGSENRKTVISSSGTYTINFSQPVPASEIAFMMIDLDNQTSAYDSLNPKFTVKVNGVQDNGIFFKDAIQTPIGGFNDNDVNYINGVVTFPSRKADQGFFIRGVGETMVTSLSITGEGLSIGDNIGLSFYNRLYCDTDGDGLPNTLELDSDNDGCSDSNEYYNNTTSAASGQQFGQTGGAVAPVKANGTVNLPAATYTSTTLANVTVATTASISTQPVNKTITAGDTTTFTVNVSSTNTSVFDITSPFAPNYGSGTTNSSNINYQWQTSVDNGANWTNITNAGVYSGATTATLIITGSTIALNNNQYRAVIKLTNNVCTNLVSNAGLLTINEIVCYNDPNTTGLAVPTNHGITLLQRAGANNGNWPMIRSSAHTVLESNTKGFVITRVANTNGITNPQEGMMVYDTTEKCLKLYDGTIWSCFSAPACP